MKTAVLSTAMLVAGHLGGAAFAQQAPLAPNQTYGYGGNQVVTFSYAQSLAPPRCRGYRACITGGGSHDCDVRNSADLLDHPADLAPFPHLPFGGGNNLLDAALNALAISLNGLRDLTTQNCQQVFNPTHGDNPNVAYYSVAGSGRSGFPPTCAAFLLFHQYIAAQAGQAKYDALVANVARLS